MAPLDPTGTFTNALAALPEVLTAHDAAAILRVGRNQLYQAVARGELGAVRIGRSIRIPKKALLGLLASASPPTASDNDEPRQPATQMRQEPSQDSR
jgi:excisionase family DNA binding protein